MQQRHSPDTTLRGEGGHLWSILMAVVAVTAGIAMDVLAKAASIDLPPAQVTLLRWFYGMVTLLPVMAVMGVRPGPIWRPIYLCRAGLNLIGSFCLYYALAHLPLAVVVTVFFLEPLGAIVLAGVFLKEAVSVRCAGGIALAMIGVVLITGLDGWQLSPDLAVAVLGALCWGGMLVLTRSLGRDEPVLSLMFWLAVVTSLAMAPIALPQWQPMDLSGHLAMLGVAVCGTVYGTLGITVLRRAPVRIKASCSFLSLPLAFIAGFLFFGEMPTTLAIGGGFAVLAGVALALYQGKPAIPAPKPVV
ncbi:MAG: DMT family transporter [Dongiaceae bacterium]